MIGQPAEREAALAALRHAMPFIRHELGSPTADPAHPGPARPARRHGRARYAHPAVLAELETGSVPDRDRPSPNRCRRRSRGSISPMTSNRSRRRPFGRPYRRGRAAIAGRKAGLGAQVVRSCAAEIDAVTVDLGPYLDAVPQSVVDRFGGGKRVLAVSHENPDADTLGATLGVVASSRRWAAWRPRVHRPVAAAVRLPRGHRTLSHRSRPRLRTTCWWSPTAARSTGSASR